jgi:hypothetical protein
LKQMSIFHDHPIFRTLSVTISVVVRVANFEDLPEIENYL